MKNKEIELEPVLLRKGEIKDIGLRVDSQQKFR